MKTVFIPATLDIELLIYTSPPSFNNFSKDKLLKILGLITELPLQKKDLLTKNGYVLIFANYFQSIAHNYVNYLSYLNENEIIKVQRSYIVGERPRGYKFCGKYQSKVKEVSLDMEDLEISMVSKNQDPYDIIRRDKVAKHVWPWVFSEKLTIDFEAAKEYLELEFDCTHMQEYNRALRRYNNGIMSINRIRKGNLYAYVDNTSFRLHTNFTNLRTDLRNFLSYENQLMISIDVSNSQPYLSTLLFNRSFYQPYQKLNITKLKLKGINKYEIERIAQAVYIILEEIENTSTILDIKKYLELVRNGGIYEYFQQQYEFAFGEPIERKKVKLEILKAFFGEHEMRGGSSTKLKRLFMKEFPNVYRVFGIIKKEGKNRLAIILQRIESYLILEIICRNIYKKYPEIPLITIHDSIATTEKYYEWIYNEMVKVFTEYFGYAPKLKIEWWAYQNSEIVSVNT